MNVKARAIKAHQENGEEWIIGVRKRITSLNKHITVDQIIMIFHASSPTMSFFHQCYEENLSPRQTVAKLMERCGVGIIFLPGPAPRRRRR